MSKVTVNYGHGPKNDGVLDVGAVGATGYRESDQNRDIGQILVSDLRNNRWEVLPVQDGDLWDVTNQSNDWGADYFISIHADSFADTSAHGITTIISGRGGRAEKIAIEVQKELVKATGLTDRGVKVDNLHVLRESNCPAILVEAGFISNPSEEALMKQDSWDKLVARAIGIGFNRALGIPYVLEEVKKLNTAVVYFSSDDYSVALLVANKLGGCAMFNRNRGTSVHADALKAEKIFTIGGPRLNVPGEVYWSGNKAEDTAQAVLTGLKTL